MPRSSRNSSPATTSEGHGSAGTEIPRFRSARASSDSGRALIPAGKRPYASFRVEDARVGLYRVVAPLHLGRRARLEQRDAMRLQALRRLERDEAAHAPAAKRNRAWHLVRRRASDPIRVLRV
jgi:hypothetical protein